jgi:hypothetical protein
MYGMKRFLRICIIMLICSIVTSCTMLVLEDDALDISIAKTSDLLLVIEQSTYSSIEASISQYVQDVENQGCSVIVQIWNGGSAEDLKETIREYHRSSGIGGAFLVGELPAAWYELEGFTGHEEFPCDVYFMDLDAVWADADDNGIYDSHSDIETDIFVSRIIGSNQELRDYLNKVHTYRVDSIPVSKGAYIFKDNDWFDFNRGSTFGLEDVYGSIALSEDATDTLKNDYLSTLTVEGVEYVYQWIHANPSLLYIEETEQYRFLFDIEIVHHNVKALFLNLYNCSASRFTEDNLAMIHLMQTDYGLASVGSTKPGGNYYPKAFHYLLSNGNTWGEAFRGWYNDFGVTDDRWFLGMVILGDPMLTIHSDVHRVLETRPLTEIPPNKENLQHLSDTIVTFTDDYNEKDFNQYRKRYSKFFNASEGVHP